MQLYIPYERLELIAYEGAGNRTPVLDLSSIENITSYSPEKILSFLENNATFRTWLQREGKLHRADSVMIYYSCYESSYNFVTFIGEPNAAVDMPFSTMCGNGIRALALHILLNEQDEELRRGFIENGIRIWAGSERVIHVERVNKENEEGTFRVNMGPFNTSFLSFRQFLNQRYFLQYRDLSSILLSNEATPALLQNRRVGLGFNGSITGEPHAVILYTPSEFYTLCSRFDVSIPDDTESMLYALRRIVSVLGKEITFTTQLFPLGINLNIGVVRGEAIYMSTHERNLSPSKDICREQQQNRRFCQCNTMACGTGGAVVANIAKSQGFISSNIVKTIHPGGELDYLLSDNDTVMIGPARRISPQMQKLQQLL